MKDIFADRTSKIDASGIRKVFALAGSMVDPVNFSIGQPDFDVPEELKQKAIDAIKSGNNKYSQTAGNGLLKDKIADSVKVRVRHNNFITGIDQRHKHQQQSTADTTCHQNF